MGRWWNGGGDWWGETCWQVDEYFNCIEFNFSNTGAYGGLYTRLSQLSWHLQKHPTHSSRRFQHDLTVARPCYVTETEYSPRFHEIPWVSICWIDAFPSSSEHFHEVPTRLTIASSVLVWVANLSNRASLEGKNRKVMEWRGRLMVVRLSEWQGDGMEGETDGERLTIVRLWRGNRKWVIASSVLVWVSKSIRSCVSQNGKMMEWRGRLMGRDWQLLHLSSFR